MEKVLEILIKEICSLEKLFRINKSYMNQLGRGDCSKIKLFYNKREKLLQDVLLSHNSLRDLSFSEDLECGDGKSKKKLSDQLSYKDQLVREIVNQDLKILLSIDQLKSGIMKDLIGA